MKFAYSTIQNGQRGTNESPALIAKSTAGSFKLTKEARIALGIEKGNKVAFATNVDAIKSAIITKDAGLVEWCNEKGVDIDDPASVDYIVSELGEYCIYKGIQMLNTNGSKQTKAHLPKAVAKDLEENFESHVTDVLENGTEAQIADMEAAETDEAKLDVLRKINTQYRDVYSGSNAGNDTNGGVSISDSAIWKLLKADLEDPSSVNREFAINIADMDKLEVSNGREMVTVDMLPLGKFTDSEPQKKGNRE